MNTLQVARQLSTLLFAIGSLSLLSGCGKHPASLTGAWEYGEAGLFSVQTTVTLHPDGRAEMSASFLGATRRPDAELTWAFENETLSFDDGKNVEEWRVISRQPDELTIDTGTANGVVRFRRVRDRKPPQIGRNAAPEAVMSKRDAILNNLRLLSAAADQFFLETGALRATYDDLVGPSPKHFLRSITPIDGEDYRKIVIRQGEPLQITTPGGISVRYSN
jgi:hypothetical protein